MKNNESNVVLRDSHRLLGENLLDDFNIFAGSVELYRLLIEYTKFKSQLENQRTDLMFLTCRSEVSSDRLNPPGEPSVLRGFVPPGREHLWRFPTLNGRSAHRISG